MQALGALTFLLVAAQTPAAKTERQVREVFYHGELVGRSVVAWGQRPDGVRWYVSHTHTNGRQGTVNGDTVLESRSAPDGAPIAAAYQVIAHDFSVTIDLAARGDRVIMVKHSETKGRPMETVQSTVRIAPGINWQFSEFNPVFVPEALSDEGVQLQIVEPTALSAVRANLQRTFTRTKWRGGEVSGHEYDFALIAGRSRSDIRVDQDGRLIEMRNSQGLSMRVTTLTKEDREVIEANVARLEKG